MTCLDNQLPCLAPSAIIVVAAVLSQKPSGPEKTAAHTNGLHDSWTRRAPAELVTLH